MSTEFGSMADEFYGSIRHYLKLEMSLGRETVLHFFDQIRKAFPSMTRMRRRDDGALILEDEVANTSRRWVRLDRHSLRLGHYAPTSPDDLGRLSDVVLEQAPYHLAFSELDYDHTEVVYGFDLEYTGNHDQLLGEVFWGEHPMSSFLLGDHATHIIDAQPYFGIALKPECDLQAYLEVKSRTNTYEVRTGDFEPRSIGVFLTTRKYWNLSAEKPLLDTVHDMIAITNELAADKVVPIVVNPLAHVIAGRS